MTAESISTGRRPGSLSEVFVMAYPTVITMFSYAVLNAVDTIFVGRLGTVELAAVGLTGVVYLSLTSIFIDTVTIVNTFTSQAYGAGQLEECSRRCWHGIYIGLISWPILIGSIWLLDDLLRVLGPSREVQAVGYEYGRIRLMGSGPFFLLIALANFFRGVGRIKLPMIAAISLSLLNVVLDYIMIFGKLGFPAMGVRGAAWASNISLGFGSTMLLIVFLGSRMHRRFKTRSTFRPNGRLLLRMARVGLPAGLQFFVDITSFTVFFSFIGRMGDVALAASQIGIQVIAISFNTCWGISVATTTLVGQYLGADRPDIALESSHGAARMVLIFTLTVTAVVVLLPERLVGLFSSDEAVIATGVLLAYMATVFLVPDSLGMIMVGVLRGAGDTTWPMVVALAGAWGLFLPLAYLFGEVLGGGVTGAWIGCIVYYIVSPTAFFLRYRGGKWKKMKV